MNSRSVSRLGQRRQVVIPKQICDELGLREGDFVELRRAENAVVIKPKKLVDPEDMLSPREQALVLKGIQQIRKGEYVTLEDLKHALAGKVVKKRKKAS